MTYTRFISDLGLDIIESREHGRQIAVKTKTRKTNRCHQCQQPQPTGTFMWRPLTNKVNRMIRLCDTCFLALGKPA